MKPLENVNGEPPWSQRLPLRLILGFYLVLGVSGLIWAFLATGSPWIPLVSTVDKTAISVGAAALFSALVITGTPMLLRISAPMRLLAQEIRLMLGQIPRWQIFVIAIASSLGEELFFRGAMQTTLGLWLTSLIFGLLHGFPGTRFAHWGIFAFGAGLGFGLLQILGDSILAPTVAHASINYINLKKILENRLQLDLNEAPPDSDNLPEQKKAPPETG